MTRITDHTHDPAASSWVESAEQSRTDFPIQNLPFGVFRRSGSGQPGRVGVAIGREVVDLSALRQAGLLTGVEGPVLDAVGGAFLNGLMGLGRQASRSLRHRLFALLERNAPDRELVGRCLFRADDVELLLPAVIGDYTDFYASIHHATNVGSMFRPENPLLPNYKYVPIGYHGRASSIVPSGTPIRRPMGQIKDDQTPEPVFGPSRSFDYECELGAWVGPGNSLGNVIPLAEAEQQIFGLSILNDWSARDIQRWEYQPLGPFLSKSFASTVSPWVVTTDALAPFRVPAFDRPAGDPDPLPYLASEANQRGGGFDIQVVVALRTAQMRAEQLEPEPISRASFASMYWTMAQLLTHHASNGCNLRPGDLLGSGTISGPDRENRGCLLELTWRGTEPLTLPTGEVRRFLQDGDEVVMRAYCERPGAASIGFGECAGVVQPA
ncbi:MAG: fumarylacetoacetase [Gemmatimonadales bacterium]|nr:fumarylacetoacetase [Gemmatimonadales bacterium]